MFDRKNGEEELSREGTKVENFGWVRGGEEVRREGTKKTKDWVGKGK